MRLLLVALLSAVSYAQTEYSVGVANEVNCPSTFVKISTVDECIAAALAKGVQFVPTLEAKFWKTTPFGCFTDRSGGDYYFNPNVYGAAHAKRFPVCKNLDCEQYLCQASTPQECADIGSQYCSWNADGFCNLAHPCTNSDAWSCYMKNFGSGFLEDGNIPSNFEECSVGDCDQCAADMISEGKCKLVFQDVEWALPDSCGMTQECFVDITAACSDDYGSDCAKCAMEIEKGGFCGFTIDDRLDEISMPDSCDPTCKDTLLTYCLSSGAVMDPSMDPTLDPTERGALILVCTDYACCKANGNLIMESYPPQCYDPISDTTFTAFREHLDVMQDPTMDPTNWKTDHLDVTQDPTMDPTTWKTDHLDVMQDPTMDPTMWSINTDACTDYACCEANGNPIMESHPAQCYDPISDTTFTENLGVAMDPTMDPTMMPTWPSNTDSLDLTEDPTMDQTMIPTWQSNTEMYDPTMDPTMMPENSTPEPEPTETAETTVDETTEAETTEDEMTEAETTEAETTEAETTEAETTEAETTKAETTKAETTKAETTKAETTEAETTEAETTEAETTEAETTKAETTKAETTKAETTEAETTEAETTEDETTEAETTEAETTEAETTVDETTEAETTGAETTEAETTEAETTVDETTEAETTEAETTEAETTEAETTEDETTEAETTEAETTEAETTVDETTEAETSEAETTKAETTEAETTEAETSEAETTKAETTEAETTKAETTEAGTTEDETTKAETTKAETTEDETTEAETTEAETTEAETTVNETTEAETTEAETTEAETTKAETTTSNAKGTSSPAAVKMQLKVNGVNEDNFNDVKPPVKKALSTKTGHPEDQITLQLVVGSRRLLTEATIEATFETGGNDHADDLLTTINNIPDDDLTSEISNELTTANVQGVTVTEIGTPTAEYASTTTMTTTTESTDAGAGQVTASDASSGPFGMNFTLLVVLGALIVCVVGLIGVVVSLLTRSSKKSQPLEDDYFVASVNDFGGKDLEEAEGTPGTTMGLSVAEEDSDELEPYGKRTPSTKYRSSNDFGPTPGKIETLGVVGEVGEGLDTSKSEEGLYGGETVPINLGDRL